MSTSPAADSPPAGAGLPDVVAIAQLRGRFADAAMRQDHDGFAALFAEDATWAVPDMGVSFSGRPAIREGVEHMLGLWEFFIQTVHPGTVLVGEDPDLATDRSYVSELGRFRAGGSQLNYAVHQDSYRRTDDGWRFAGREYRFLYVDETRLAGRASPPATALDG